MTDTQVLEIVRESLIVSAKLAGPILMVTLVLGIGVSLLQTVTQIQEMTLTFVPKLAAVAVVLLLSGNWMMRMLTEWVIQLWANIPALAN